MLNDKSILITGGTGSFGKKSVATVLERFPKVRRLVVYSRDELKQSEMQQQYPREQYPQLRFFIGDVRDERRLWRAMEDIDVVVHAAALKHVPVCEYNPFEAIKTNVHGAQNVIDAALEREVERVIALSTDKASSPINLYGATKLVSDKLFVAANAYAGAHPTRFSVVRYGNVIGSRGSVVPAFQRLAETGVIPITDERMTRFWITLDQGVEFVIKMIGAMSGGELFVPRIPSMKLIDLATAIAPHARIEIVGIRPGEKLHEEMIGVDDARRTRDAGDFYVMQPDFDWWSTTAWHDAEMVPPGFRYTSDANSQWLTVEDLRRLLDA